MNPTDKRLDVLDSRRAADEAVRDWAALVVQMGLAGAYGVYAHPVLMATAASRHKRPSRRYGVFVGRHDDQDMTEMDASALEAALVHYRRGD